MVKNYLVGSVRPVVKIWYGHTAENTKIDNANADSALQIYKNMYSVSRASARKFLEGSWEEVLFSSPVLDARMFQIAQWYAVREMWFKEPCNILCMGADTMFVQPTEMFGRWPEMRMFNYTDPKFHNDLKPYTDSGHYFNDDVRYFPAKMDPKIWEIGERRMADWFTHSQAHWDCGQLINNHMFWSQDIDLEDRLHPYFNWMSHCVRTFDDSSVKQAEEWNQCTFDDANIIHFNGSRGPEHTLNFMNEIANKLNLGLQDETMPKL
jgi:hypothetical protein